MRQFHHHHHRPVRGRSRSFYVCLFAAFLLGCTGHAGSESSQEAKKTVVKAPDFQLTDLHGKKISLVDLKGKVVFLDFWATWCPPCVVSVPEVAKMIAEYKGKNLEVISISLDSKEGPVRRFIAKHNMTNRVALAGESGVDQKYGVSGIPSFFVIDKNGNLAGVWEGYHPMMPKQWRKEVDQLLGA